MIKNHYFKKCYMWFADQVAGVKKELKKEIYQPHTHKIVHVDVCQKTGRFQIEFTVSCVAKALFFKTTAQELLNDNATLKCFSALDIKLISVLATKEYYDTVGADNKFYTVIQQDFDESGKTLFTIHSFEEMFQKSAEEILCDEQLLKNLSVQDIASVAFTAGCEIERRKSNAKSIT